MTYKLDIDELCGKTCSVTGVDGSFNVQKYNNACVKENMIGILEKSIYELLHNNIDTPALSVFSRKFNVQNFK